MAGILLPTHKESNFNSELFHLLRYEFRMDKNCLTLFFILTKITIHMAMRINVATTPTRTPSTGVIWTRTARDDAGNSQNIIYLCLETFAEPSFSIWLSIKGFTKDERKCQRSEKIFRMKKQLNFFASAWIACSGQTLWEPQTCTCLDKWSWHCFHSKLVEFLTHSLQVVWCNLHEEKINFELTHDWVKSLRVYEVKFNAIVGKLTMKGMLTLTVNFVSLGSFRSRNVGWSVETLNTISFPSNTCKLSIVYSENNWFSQFLLITSTKYDCLMPPSLPGTHVNCIV